MVEFAGQVGDPHRPLGGAIWAEEETASCGEVGDCADGQDVETVSGMADVVLAAMWRCVDHVVALRPRHIMEWGCSVVCHVCLIRY